MKAQLALGLDLASEGGPGEPCKEAGYRNGDSYTLLTAEGTRQDRAFGPIAAVADSNSLCFELGRTGAICAHYPGTRDE